MAPGVDAVNQMFEELLSASLDAGKRELVELTAYAQENGHQGDLEHWDTAFWAERMREEKFAFTDEELRPYFSLDRVLDGLFSLCGRLFGISVKAADGKAAVWHPDVRFFEIFDESDKHIASFFLDPFSRPENKRGGAWMNGCVDRVVTGGSVRLPVAHLVCNGSPPVDGAPSLMTFREVGNPIPRIRPWPPAHADHRGSAGRGRHQWGRMGRGRAAQSIHGKLVLPPSHPARHGQAPRNR